MSVFAFPALIALLTKIWVYLLARNAKHTSQTFLWLLVFFALHNLAELAVISKFFSIDISESLLRLYYVAALFSLAYMCIFAMSVGNKEKYTRLNYVLIGLAAAESLLVFSTDLIVAGAVSAGYTVTAIKGTYYFIFQFTALVGFVWILYPLIKRYFTTTDSQVQLSCFYAVLSFSPIIVMSLIVLAMMQMGYPYTGAIVLPFVSTFFLLLLILTEKNNDLIRIRYKLPFSNRNATEKQLLGIFRAHLNDQLSLVETKHELEKILIQSALDSSHGNVTWAADKLGIKRSTLYSILNRLDMKRGIADNGQ